MRSRLILGALVMVAFTAMVISSCESKEALPVIALPSNCDTTHLTYNGGIDSLINTQCAVSGCHVPRGGAGAASFTTYAGLSSYASGGKSAQIYTCLMYGNPYRMPNVAQPGWNTCDLDKITQWVLDGAPQ